MRDRFGIKPFYYATVGDVLYFASEAKSLLPFLGSIETDLNALKDYLAFQFCLAGKMLFKGVEDFLPGHFLRIGRCGAQPSRWTRWPEEPPACGPATVAAVPSKIVTAPSGASRQIVQNEYPVAGARA